MWPDDRQISLDHCSVQISKRVVRLLTLMVPLPSLTYAERNCIYANDKHTALHETGLIGIGYLHPSKVTSALDGPDGGRKTE